MTQDTRVLVDNKTSRVMNIILWDENSDYQPPPGISLLLPQPGVHKGDIWDGAKFSRPPKAPLTRTEVLLAKRVDKSQTLSAGERDELLTLLDEELRDDSISYKNLKELIRLSRGM